jgi:hypothetical protein
LLAERAALLVDLCYDEVIDDGKRLVEILDFHPRA